MTKAKRKGAALDVAMAALAASSVAFAVYAMPDWRFEAAVQASGLPHVLSAANPPLGTTARLAMVAVAAIGTFLAAWLILSWLGRKSPPRRGVVETTELPAEAPKVRRADAHPDAPSRLPIRAGLDLGEPGASEELEPEEDTVSPEIYEETAPARFTLLQQPPETDWDSEAEPFPFSDQDVTPAEEPAAPVQDVLEVEQESIPHLMQRLEVGLARRERNYRPVAAAEPITATPRTNRGEPNRMDERLRDAIADLQKLTARR